MKNKTDVLRMRNIMKISVLSTSTIPMLRTLRYQQSMEIQTMTVVQDIL